MSRHSKSTKRIVVVGGGTGIFAVLTGLKHYPAYLTAVVSMCDDGGSTGRLRDELGALPPGDIRRSLIALSKSDKLLRHLFEYRFSRGDVAGHSFGNLFLTALEQITGDFALAVQKASEILRVKGEVVPVTLDDTRLVAQLENGKLIKGESNIDVPKHDGSLKIEKLWLEPRAQVNTRVKQVCQEADAIVIGPGDLYTSILPNLLAEGFVESLRATKAKIYYVANIMTKYGETNGYHLLDFIKVLEKYLGKDIIDVVFYNNKRPGQERLEKYEDTRAEFVTKNRFDFKAAPWKLVEGNYLKQNGFVRHDPIKIAKAIYSELESRI